MVKLGTVCNECVFYKDKCDLGMLEKFKERGAEIQMHDDGPRIARICPYRRTPEWSKDLAYPSFQVYSEVYITGSIVIKARSVDGLISTIDNLNRIPKIGSFLIVVMHDDSIAISDVKRCASRIVFSEYQCVKTFLDGPDALNEAFKRCKNGYLFILDSEKEFDIEMIDKVNFIVNEELFQLLHIEPIDENQSVTSAIMYKYLNGDIIKPIGEKIKEMGGESMIMTWEEVNDYYQRQK